jgi:hypothetical protein
MCTNRTVPRQFHLDIMVEDVEAAGRAGALDPADA